MNLRIVFGDDLVGRKLIMEKMWEIRTSSGLSKSDALKKAYAFYSCTVFARPKKVKKIDFNINNFLNSSNQVEYLKKCYRRTIKRHDWLRIITSGKLSEEFISEYLQEIFCGIDSRMYSVNQKLSEKNLLEVVRGVHHGYYLNVIREQFNKFVFREEHIRKVLNYMIRQNEGIGWVLSSIFSGSSNLSVQFYLDYQEYIFDHCTDTLTQEEVAIWILERRGKELPYKFISSLLKKVTIDRDLVQYYANYDNKFFDWLSTTVAKGISVKKSKRRVVFVLNEDKRIV